VRRFRPDGAVLARWALGLCALSACLNPMPDDFPNQHDRPAEVTSETAGDSDDPVAPGASDGAGGGGYSVPLPTAPPPELEGGEPADEGEPDAGAPASVRVGDAGVVHGTP